MIKIILSIWVLTSALLAVECGNSYDRNGCDEVSFGLGSDMAIQQYQVIYDDDQDGVRESIDRCLDTPLKAKVDKYGCHKVEEPKVEVVEEVVEEEILEEVAETQDVQVVTLEVYFKTAKYDILKEYHGEVEEFAEFLMENPDFKARIVGHTDSRSKYTNNMELSKNRANAVKDALIALGVEASRLSSDGVGPNEPVATNSTASGRAQNRRIEVTLTRDGE
ncbi:OmpA family protein [Sulfurimonas aquatica]|uniref:OmpA family protein n=1 Tax=Sulfurimonas aquatica TaxID=2672570 RepID=A0A975AZU1_9BACT|nr:OmpA family protein [Sulfurimonas aquatica]QSZ41520.1 OmpA family protein [Sulfurimonas aquatica]